MPATLEALRSELAHRRHAGVPFDDAWPEALAAALRVRDREEWTSALTATRPAWHAAYTGAPASKTERALTLVGEDREPLEDVGGRCERCEEPIPAGKRPTARYCSRGCQRAANGRRVLDVGGVGRTLRSSPRKRSVRHARGRASRLARMPIQRTSVDGVSAIYPLRQSPHGISASFMVRADDGCDYWCKAVNNPCSPRIPTNEQVAGRLARLVGVWSTNATLVDLTGIAGWEFTAGRRVEAGWAHGAEAIPGALEIRDLQHRGDDDNRIRHAGFYALMDWLAGGDQQWLYSTVAQNAYFSHDHGHFFPSGPDWTVAGLQATGTQPRLLGLPTVGLDGDELGRLANAIESTSRNQIDDVMSKLPAAWPVSDSELDQLATFVDGRRSPVAARLRALVP